MSALDFKNKGNAAFSSGDYKSSIEFFTQAIELEPTNHILYSNRSGSYAALKDYEHAFNDAEKCISLKSDWAKGYGRKGTALCFLKRYDDAINAYNEGLKLEPTNAQLKQGLKDTEDAKEKDNANNNNPMAKMFSGPELWTKIATNPKLSKYMAQPDFIQRVQEIQKNPNALNSYIQQDPRIMELFAAVLGLDLKAGGQGSGVGGDEGDEEEAYSEAPTQPQQSQSSQSQQPTQQPTPPPKPQPQPPTKPAEPEISPEEKEKKERLAKAVQEKEIGNDFYKKKQLDEAIQHYTKATELDPKEMTYLLNLSAAYFEKKDYEQTIQVCQKAIDVGRDNGADDKQIAKALARIGSAYVNLEKFDEGINSFKQALVEHRNPEVVQKLQQAEKQKKITEELRYQDPKLSDEAREKGNELFKQDKYPEAAKFYEEAIKRNPKDPKNYSNRAACYMKLGDFIYALKDCDKAIELDPTFVKAFVRKGTCHMVCKEHHKSIQAFEDGLKIDPNNAELKEGLQKVSRAIAMQQRSSESDPEQVKRAMADPEIQSILSDPVMNQILKDLSENPAAAKEHLANASVVQKLQKLVAAGVLKMN